MSLVLNVEILGEFKNLTAATKGAQGQLNQMNARAQKVSSQIKGAFAAIGIGLSFRWIANELEDATKAAIEDSKSQQLLALAMKNTGKATDAQVKSSEALIQKMQFSAGVADDKLRPAYQKLFIATGSVTESSRLLQIALDASAATGKSLDSVSQAMAKSLAGSDTALLRLIPSLKGAKDPMAELEATFKGAAEAAANTDPYQRMNVLFQDMQEQIGTALLPLLNEFSTWLATPEGQEKLQGLVNLIKDILANFGETVRYIIENKDWLLPLVAGIGALKLAWEGAQFALAAYKVLEKVFAGESIANAARVAAAWNLANAAKFGAIGLGVGALAWGISETVQGRGKTSSGQNFSTSFGDVKVGGKGKKTSVQPKGGDTIVINVKTIDDANTTIKKLKKLKNSTGTPLNAKALGLF